MKKAKAVLAITTLFCAIAAGTLVTGCRSYSDHEAHEHNAEHVHQYTCPHHPEVVQSTAGDCPKCGMKLVHKE